MNGGDILAFSTLLVLRSHYYDRKSWGRPRIFTHDTSVYPERRSFQQVKVATLGSSALLGALQEGACGGCSALLESKTKMNTELAFPGAAFSNTDFVLWILQASLCLALQQLGETSRRLPSLLNTQHDSDLSLQHKGWAWKCGLLFS